MFYLFVPRPSVHEWVLSVIYWPGPRCDAMADGAEFVNWCPRFPMRIVAPEAIGGYWDRTYPSNAGLQYPVSQVPGELAEEDKRRITDRRSVFSSRVSELWQSSAASLGEIKKGKEKDNRRNYQPQRIRSKGKMWHTCSRRAGFVPRGGGNYFPYQCSATAQDQFTTTGQGKRKQFSNTTFMNLVFTVCHSRVEVKSQKDKYDSWAAFWRNFRIHCKYE